MRFSKRLKEEIVIKAILPFENLFEGGKVLINVGLITSRRDYESKSEPFKEFIEESKGKIFTIKKVSPFVSLVEDSRWLFFPIDLIKVV